MFGKQNDVRKMVMRLKEKYLNGGAKDSDFKKVLNSKDKYGKTILMYASEYGYLEEVRFLLEVGAAIDTKDNSGMNALMYATLKGHKHLIKILKKGDMVYESNSNKMTVFDYAVKDDDKDMLELLMTSILDDSQLDIIKNLLIKYQVSPDSRVYKFYTDMLRFKSLAKKNTLNEDEVQKILDIFRMNDVLLSYESLGFKENRELIMSLLRINDPTINSTILEKFDAEFLTFDFVKSLLLCGVTEEYETVIIDLIARDKLIDTFDILRIAISRNNNKIVRHIVEEGCDFGKYDIFGHTLLIHSIIYDNSFAVDLLLQKGANINQKDDNNGRTPLMYAVMSRKVELVNLLLNRGALTDIKDNNGFTVIKYALERNDLRIISLLQRYLGDKFEQERLQYQQQMNARNNEATTIFDIVDNLREDLVEEILRQLNTGDESQRERIKDDLCKQDENGRNVIHHIIESSIDNTELKRRLIARISQVLKSNFPSIDLINMKDNDGDAPIHVAVLKNEFELIKELIANNADVNQIGSEGNTPLVLSIIYGANNGERLVNMVEILIGAGASRDVLEAHGFDMMYVINNSIRDPETKLKVKNYFLQDPMFAHYVELQNIEKLKEILRKGSSIDLYSKDKNNDTALDIAICRNDRELLTLLIKRGFKPAKRNTNKPFLIWLIQQGYFDLAKIVISNIENLDQVDNNGNTPLHLAVENGNIDFLKFLIEHGADVDSRNNFGETPIAYAVGARWLIGKDVNEIVEYLIESGCDCNINVRTFLGLLNELPLIFWIMKQERFDLALQAINDDKINVDTVNSEDKTLLMLVLENIKEIEGKNIDEVSRSFMKQELLSIFKVLIFKGANLQYKDKRGNTPLIFALRNKMQEEAILLIKSGAELTEVDGKPFANYVLENNLNEVIAYLFQDNFHMADELINKLRPNNLAQLLIYFFKNEINKGALSLIERGANVSYVDADGKTPLYYATKFGNSEIIKRLLETDIQVDIDIDGTPFLIWLIKNGHEKCLDAAIDLSLNINVVDTQGKTLLHWAVERGDTKSVKTLVFYGIDIDVKDKDGKCALDIAKFKGNQTIISILCVGERTKSLKDGRINIIKRMFKTLPPNADSREVNQLARRFKSKLREMRSRSMVSRYLQSNHDLRSLSIIKRQLQKLKVRALDNSQPSEREPEIEVPSEVLFPY